MSSTVIKPRTAVVTIYNGDYLDRIQYLEQRAEALEDAIERAKKDEANQPRLAHETSDSVRLVAEHDDLVDQRDALRDEAEASALNVRVQALGRRAWKTLIAEHPPRTAGGKVTEDDAKADADNGVNSETFRDALVAASIIEPDLTAEDLDQLSAIDFDRIYLTAFSLNRVPNSDPKASPVSRLTQKSDETSS